MTDKYSYILQGMCDGNCYCCLLPCEDRDKPIQAYTPKKIQDESSDDFVGYAKPNNEIKQEDKKSMIYILRTF